MNCYLCVDFHIKILGSKKPTTDSRTPLKTQILLRRVCVHEFQSVVKCWRTPATQQSANIPTH